MKLIKGDTVFITKGKDKGKTGKIEKVFKHSVLVEGLNQYKRHMKGRPGGQKSEIVTITKPLPVANVMFLCPKCAMKARVGYKIMEAQKVRICKKCEQEV